MKRFLLFSILAIITSCDKKSLFVDQYNPVYKANPFFSGFSNCLELAGTMVSATEAIVYTGTYALYSGDNFKTLRYFQYPINGTNCPSRVVYFDGINAWVNPLNSSQNFYTLVQRNSTLQLNGFNDFVFNPPANNFVLTETKPFFLDSISFIFCRTDYPFGTAANIYKGNALTRTASKISSFVLDKPNYQPISVQIVNNTFIAIFNYSKTYSFISNNNGSTWQGPFLFTPIDPFLNILEGISGAESTMISRFYSLKDFQSSGIVKYRCNFSLDKGKTWSAFTGLPSDVKFAQAISNNVIYAVFDASGNGLFDVSKLAKSFDGGKSWTIEDKLIYANKISFYDELNGIAIMDQFLQLTNDGGKTWKLILSRPY